MSTSIDRLADVQAELSEEIARLDRFIENGGTAFVSLTEENKYLLRGQHAVMVQYYGILQRRIDINT